MGRRRRIGRRRRSSRRRRRRRRRERRRAGPGGSGESAGAATAVASVLSSPTQAADQQQLKMDSKLVFPLVLVLLATIIDSGELTVLILTDVKSWEGKKTGSKRARMTCSRQRERSQMADARTGGWVVKCVRTMLLVAKLAEHHGLLPDAAAAAPFAA